MKLPYKMIILVFFTLIAAFSVQISVTIQWEKARAEKENHTQKKNIAKLICSMILVQGQLNQPEKWTVMEKVLAEYEDIYFCRFLDNQGKVYSSGNREIDLLVPPRDQVTPILIQDFEYNNKKINLLLYPAGEGGVLYLGYSRQTITAIIKGFASFCFLLFFVTLLMGGIFSLFLVRSITRPLKELVKGAGIIGNGNLNYKLTLDSGDEIQEAGEAVNKMTQALKNSMISRKYMTSVLNNMTDTLFITDRDARIVLINTAVNQSLEYSEEELLGKSLKIIFPGEDAFKKSVNLQDLVEKKEFLSSETIFCTRSGRQIPVLISASLMDLEQDDSEKIIFLGKEITDFKKSQKQINDIYHKLVATAHKAGMAEIAVGVLHNIGNILTSVYIFVESIQNKLKDSALDRMKMARDLIEKNKNNLEEFFSKEKKGAMLIEYICQVTGMLEQEHQYLKNELHNLMQKVDLIRTVVITQQDYARNDLYIEEINLYEIIEDTLKMDSATFQKHNIHIKKDIEAIQGLKLRGQKSKVLDILLNLYKNSMDAMSNQTGEKLIMLLGEQDDENRLLLKVSDNGPGIPGEIRKKIFNFGFTTKTTGNGFGLHSSAIFMKEMGGEIRVEEKEDGAAFTLIFPLHNKN